MTLKNNGRNLSDDLVVKCLVVDDRPANREHIWNDPGMASAAAG